MRRTAAGHHPADDDEQEQGTFATTSEITASLCDNDYDDDDDDVERRRNSDPSECIDFYNDTTAGSRMNSRSSQGNHHPNSSRDMNHHHPHSIMNHIGSGGNSIHSARSRTGSLNMDGDNQSTVDGAMTEYEVDSDPGLGGDTNHEEDANYKRQQMILEVKRNAQKEIKLVASSRRIFYIILFTCACSATLLTYFAVRHVETTAASTTGNAPIVDAPETGIATDDATIPNPMFQLYANDIQHSMKVRFQDTVQDVIQLTFFISSYVSDQQSSSSTVSSSSSSSSSLNHSAIQRKYDYLVSSSGVSTAWPFVTIPAFDTYASYLVGSNHDDDKHNRRSNHSDNNDNNNNRGSGISHMSIVPFVSWEELWSWSTYSVMNQGWIHTDNSPTRTYIPSQMFHLEEKGTEVMESSQRTVGSEYSTTTQSTYPGAPIWQTYPRPDPSDINYNVLSRPDLQSMYDTMIQTKQYVMSPMGTNDWLPSNAKPNSSTTPTDNNKIFSSTASTISSILFFPIFQDKNKKNDIVAMIVAEIDWKQLLLDQLDMVAASSLSSLVSASSSSCDIISVRLQNTCGQSSTFHLHTETGEIDSIGEGTDDPDGDDIDNNNNQSVTFKLGNYKSDGNDNVTTHCYYSIMMYPTVENESYMDIVKNQKLQFRYMDIIVSVVVAITYIIVLLAFLLFDSRVQKKVRAIIGKAADSNHILSSLFPSTVRDRLFQASAYAETDVMPMNEQLASKNGLANTSNKEDCNGDLAGFLNNDSGAANNNYLSRFSHKGRLSGSVDDNKSFDDIFDNDGDDSENDAIVFKTKPIADLFPEVTIMFTDMVGFTAWSSVREPTQVFTLLESLYHAFDQIAKRRKVFKVETIGDCYVAVAGLPEPRPDHATVMCRFANDCLKKVHVLTKKLMVVLGPDTEDLTMRCGLHSGPVTAGVLRGERSRFQLFGDTMNTASRMESTGVKDKIQISQETADLLISAGKVHWLTQREDKVIAKGKGEVETYWLNIDPIVTQSSHDGNYQDVPIVPLRENDDDGEAFLSPTRSGSSESFSMLPPIPTLPATPTTPTTVGFSSTHRSLHKNSSNRDNTNYRLIDWNVELLLRQLKLIAASRIPANKSNGLAIMKQLSSLDENFEKFIGNGGSDDGTTVLDEVREVIRLPNFNAKSFKSQKYAESIELPDGVENELRQYVTLIAQRYRKNPFHSFEHASHVTMSVSKLLSRIVQPTSEIVAAATTASASVGGEPTNDIIHGGAVGSSADTNNTTSNTNNKKRTAAELHGYSYGITSDPLTQFACLLSALIHDVDHSGVPNSVIPDENPSLANKYKNKSIAEQNSVDIAWNLLFQNDDFQTLRHAIYSNTDELTRFRQLVVNSVMATDIMDKDLKQLRNNRWDKAFSNSSSNDNNNAKISMKQLKEEKKDNLNRKATIVIEHLIQASDVAHTMQHWHIYRKWNERLFVEMYIAYKNGRTKDDPTINWYEGELNFFDYYIIPLAKKLKDCGVFGVSSDEYLNYAQTNRNEFAERGKAVIEEMIQKYQLS